MDIMFLRFEHTDLKGVKEQRNKKKKIYGFDCHRYCQKYPVVWSLM